MEHSILFIDDEPAILSSLRRQLSDLPYKLSFALNGNAGMEALESETFSMIISDMRMSEMSGVELLKKAVELQPDAVRIILTGYADVEAAVAAINEAKVDAYITKPWSENNIRDEISKGLLKYENRVKKEKEISDLRIRSKKSEKELEKLSGIAMTDPLTELPNRRHFEEHFDHEWHRAVRNKNNLSFLMLDVDHFKRINDTLGHAEGDRVLKDIAVVLKESLRRPGDFVARFGGEEFAAILPDVADLCYVAELMRVAVQQVTVKDSENGGDRAITISIGGCSCFPTDCKVCNPENLFKNADAALYEAKKTGRNKVVIKKFM